MGRKGEKKDVETGEERSEKEGVWEKLGEMKPEETEEPRDAKQKKHEKSEGKAEESGEEKGTVLVKPGELSEKGRNIERILREVRKGLGELLEHIRYAMGEYKAVKQAIEGERLAGHAPGVMGEAEYRRMRTLTVPLEVQFLREVGESVSEPKVTYTRHSDDAYWLPAEEEEERSRVLLLLDSSPSIMEKELMLFMNLVRKAMETYDIEYEVSVFSVGEVDHKVLNLDEFNEKEFRVKRGLGTVWDATIAERIRKAAEQGIKLIQVLSDFAIDIKPEVYEEIKRFKALGGKISCYSVTGKYLTICDFRHNIRLV